MIAATTQILTPWLTMRCHSQQQICAALSLTPRKTSGRCGPHTARAGGLRKALSWPARQIVINAGEDGSIIVGKILEKDQYGFGFDAQNGEYVNLVSKGIIDPTKVVRAAWQTRRRSPGF